MDQTINLMAFKGLPMLFKSKKIDADSIEVSFANSTEPEIGQEILHNNVIHVVAEILESRKAGGIWLNERPNFYKCLIKRKA